MKIRQIGLNQQTKPIVLRSAIKQDEVEEINQLT